MKEYTSSHYSHTPVFAEEIKQFFEKYTHKYIFDCTLGEGGHSEFFLESFLTNIFLVGIERDPVIFQKARKRLERFREKVELINGSFSRLDVYFSRLHRPDPVTCILFDIGISSFHVDESGRGFSFRKSEPLDMRFDPSDGISAYEVVNGFTKEDLADIIYEYGEERNSRRIADLIVRSRKSGKIETSLDLAEIVLKAFPRRRYNRIHPATRVFQALRIYVNNELEEFKLALEKSVEILGSGGRIIVISYHSLEDRIVKRFFKSLSPENFKILTKKPLRPSLEEIEKNRRSRSAKIRVLERK
ncbi:16S rRNA (cytosine(1402)-N(4))-methyltransferase RsmH [Candidatus Dependentiae bacterium]|nr:16S rRNA (cytosine(1402)-N(4))-methyltransferase RsmH [Candidatus Dependentiae bacterium]